MQIKKNIEDMTDLELLDDTIKLLKLKLRNKRNYEKNKKQRLAYAKEKYSENKQQLKRYYKIKDTDEYKTKTKKYNTEYHQLNKIRQNERSREYRKNNVIKVTKKIKMWKKRNPGYYKKYYKSANLYRNNKKKSDIGYKLGLALRNRLYCALKNQQKRGSAVKDLGCSVEELKIYIESKFQPEMTWENWEINGWHIDHITPLAWFNLEDRNQFLVACHYTNLQPMWADNNWRKSKN